MDDRTSTDGRSGWDTTAAAILRTAALGGVDDLWMTTGSDLTAFQEGVAQLRAAGQPTPRLITAPHEHVGLTAAMGQTMVTGRPAMTAVHADLGVLHHGGALHNALVGRYPVLMMSGYPPVTPERRGHPVYWYQQRFDQGATIRQYVQWDYKLSQLEDPAVVTARALQIATSPPVGPVYLAVPDEVGRAPARRDVDAAWTAPPLELGAGAEDGVAEIAGRLSEAHRPVLVLERAGRDPRTVELATRIADNYALPVVARRYRLNIPDGHAWLVPEQSLAQADAVVALESPVPWVPARHGPPADTWCATVGTDPLAEDVPLWEFRVDRALQADPFRFLLALEGALADTGVSAQRREERQRWVAEQTPSAASAHSWGPASVATALDELLDPDDLLVSEVFDTTPIRRTRPGTLFEKGASSLGWAQAAAIGARYGCGDRPTVAVTGDGSFLFGAPTSALLLQQSLDAPVTTVILNNGGYRTGTTTLRAHYPDGAAIAAHDLSGGLLEPIPDHAAQAVAAGAYGATAAGPGELRAALAAARREVEDCRVPAVVDVRLPSHRVAALR